ncbi:unnamed protein product [Amoebophrya sp. A120]|nr:unnamed protein product [Amoebophrya sp. A120]|eukprot:GSA120T00005880001.1
MDLAKGNPVPAAPFDLSNLSPAPYCFLLEETGCYWTSDLLLAVFAFYHSVALGQDRNPHQIKAIHAGDCCHADTTAQEGRPAMKFAAVPIRKTPEGEYCLTELVGFLAWVVEEQTATYEVGMQSFLRLLESRCGVSALNTAVAAWDGTPTISQALLDRVYRPGKSAAALVSKIDPMKAVATKGKRPGEGIKSEADPFLSDAESLFDEDGGDFVDPGTRPILRRDLPHIERTTVKHKVGAWQGVWRWLPFILDPRLFSAAACLLLQRVRSRKEKDFRYLLGTKFDTLPDGTFVAKSGWCTGMTGMDFKTPRPPYAEQTTERAWGVEQMQRDAARKAKDPIQHFGVETAKHYRNRGYVEQQLRYETGPAGNAVPKPTGRYLLRWDAPLVAEVAGHSKSVISCKKKASVRHFAPGSRLGEQYKELSGEQLRDRVEKGEIEIHERFLGEDEEYLVTVLPNYVHSKQKSAPAPPNALSLDLACWLLTTDCSPGKPNYKPLSDYRPGTAEARHHWKKVRKLMGEFRELQRKKQQEGQAVPVVDFDGLGGGNPEAGEAGSGEPPQEDAAETAAEAQQAGGEASGGPAEGFLPAANAKAASGDSFREQRVGVDATVHAAGNTNNKEVMDSDVPDSEASGDDPHGPPLDHAVKSSKETRSLFFAQVLGKKNMKAAGLGFSSQRAEPKGKRMGASGGNDDGPAAYDPKRLQLMATGDDFDAQLADDGKYSFGEEIQILGGGGSTDARGPKAGAVMAKREETSLSEDSLSENSEDDLEALKLKERIRKLKAKMKEKQERRRRRDAEPGRLELPTTSSGHGLGVSGAVGIEDGEMQDVEMQDVEMEDVEMETGDDPDVETLDQKPPPTTSTSLSAGAKFAQAARAKLTHRDVLGIRVKVELVEVLPEKPADEGSAAAAASRTSVANTTGTGADAATAEATKMTPELITLKPVQPKITFQRLPTEEEKEAEEDERPAVLAAPSAFEYWRELYPYLKMKLFKSAILVPFNDDDKFDFQEGRSLRAALVDLGVDADDILLTLGIPARLLQKPVQWVDKEKFEKHLLQIAPRPPLGENPNHDGSLQAEAELNRDEDEVICDSASESASASEGEEDDNCSPFHSVQFLRDFGLNCAVVVSKVERDPRTNEVIRLKAKACSCPRSLHIWLDCKHTFYTDTWTAEKDPKGKRGRRKGTTDAQKGAETFLEGVAVARAKEKDKKKAEEEAAAAAAEAKERKPLRRKAMGWKEMNLQKYALQCPDPPTPWTALARPIFKRWLDAGFSLRLFQVSQAGIGLRMFTKATQFGSYAEATEVQAVAKGLLKQKKEGLLEEEDATQGADFADVVRAVVDTLNRPSAHDVISHLLAEGESRSKTYYGHYKGCTGPKLRDVLGQAVNCLVAINVLAVQHLKFTDSRQRRVEYDALFVPLREAAASSSKPAGRGQGKAPAAQPPPPAAQPPPPAASSSRNSPNISTDTGAKSKNAGAVSSSSSVVPAQAKKAPVVSGSRGAVFPTSSIGPFPAAGSSAGACRQGSKSEAGKVKSIPSSFASGNIKDSKTAAANFAAPSVSARPGKEVNRTGAASSTAPSVSARPSKEGNKTAAATLGAPSVTASAPDGE